MGTLRISIRQLVRRMIRNDLAYIVDADRSPLDPACKRTDRERTGIYVQLRSRVTYRSFISVGRVAP